MRALRALNRSSTSPSTLVRPQRRPHSSSSRMVAMAASRHSAEDAARLERAKSYPYARPSSSFIYINGHAFVFDCAAWPAVSAGGRWLTDLPLRPPPELLLPNAGASSPDETLVSVVEACDRFFGFCARRALELPPPTEDAAAAPAPEAGHFTPILAVGSNAGVAQLARKFPSDLFPAGVVVPVVRALLRDFDVAFAPLVTSYGSTPATLHPSPGTHVELFVTHLTPAQAKRMHETEGAYNLQRLTNVALREGAGIEHLLEKKEEGGGGGAPSLLGAPTSTRLLTYGHQAGTLRLRFRRRAEEEEHLETPVALAEIRAHGRRFPALTQREMLRAVRHALHAAEEEGEGEGATTADNSSGSGSDTSDALPPPRPLPPILHPEHAQDCWLGTEEAELDKFLLRCLDCADTRKKRVERLTAAAVAFHEELEPPAQVEVLQTMGTVLSDNVK